MKSVLLVTKPPRRCGIHLAPNTMNRFFYERMMFHGPGSVIDTTVPLV